MNATYDTPIFGGQAQQNTGIDFSQLIVAPSASMKLNEKHAIGASVNLVYQRMKINGVGDFGFFSSDPASLTNQGYDSSTGGGISLGWQGQVTPKVKAGLAYRSVTKMGNFDKYKGLFAEQGGFDIPSMITAGISIEASPKTSFAIDVARINYTDVKSISNDNNTAVLQGAMINAIAGGANPQTPEGQQAIVGAIRGSGNPLLGDDDGAGFGWDDQNVIKIGVKHQLNNKLALMGGLNHGKAPIGNDQTAFNVLAPATVEDHLTLGMDWKLTPKSSITVSYMHAFENEIKADRTIGANQQLASPGSYIPAGPTH